MSGPIECWECGRKIHNNEVVYRVTLIQYKEDDTTFETEPLESGKYICRDCEYIP